MPSYKHKTFYYFFSPQLLCNTLESGSMRGQNHLRWTDTNLFRTERVLKCFSGLIKYQTTSSIVNALVSSIPWNENSTWKCVWRLNLFSQKTIQKKKSHENIQILVFMYKKWNFPLLILNRQTDVHMWKVWRFKLPLASAFRCSNQKTLFGSSSTEVKMNSFFFFHFLSL